MNNLTVSNVDLDPADGAAAIDGLQTFAFSNAALAGAADVLTLTLDNVRNTQGGNTAATGRISLNTTAGQSNYETVNVVSNGTTNVANIGQVGNGLTALNVSGPAAFTTVNNSANLTTFNAGSANGVINYTEGAAVGNASYTGGSANDTINLAATLTVNDTVNGGAGNADILAGTAASIDSTQFAAAANTANISNFEILQAAGDASAGTGIINANLFTGVNQLNLTAQTTAANLTVNTAAGAFTVNDVNGTGFGAADSLTVDVAGAAITDAATLIVNANAGNTAVDFGNDVVFQDYETVTINTLDGDGTTIQGALTVTPNIGGAATLNFTGLRGPVVTGATTASVITGAALTNAGYSISGVANAANITGSGFADNLVGSAQADAINAGNGADLVDGNGGADGIALGGGFDTLRLSTFGAGGALNAAGTSARVADFVTGLTATTTDFVQINATAINNILNGLSAGSTLETPNGTDVTAASAAQFQTVLQGVALNIAASTATILKLNGTNNAAGATAQAAFGTALGGAVLTIAATTQDNDSILVTYFDAANQQTVIGAVAPGVTGQTTIEAADIFTPLVRFNSTAAEFANFGAVNFAADPFV